MRHLSGFIILAIALIGCNKDSGSSATPPPAPGTGAQPEPTVPKKPAVAPVSLVVLVSGMETWIGNETYTESKDDTVAGTYAALGPALAQLVTIGSPGSEAALVTYGKDRPELRLPFSDLASLDAAALGSQKDYSGNIQPLLRAGLVTARTELTPRAAKRRILVVFGDGIDLDNQNDAPIQAEIDALAKAGIEVYTVCVTPSTDEPRCDRMKTIGKNGSFNAASPADLGATTTKLVEAVAAGG